MTEQPNREVALLNAALELPATERAAYGPGLRGKYYWTHARA